MYLGESLLQLNSLRPETLELCLHPHLAQLHILQWLVQRDASRVQLQTVLLQPDQLVSDGQLLLLRLPLLSLQGGLLLLQLRDGAKRETVILIWMLHILITLNCAALLYFSQPHVITFALPSFKIRSSTCEQTMNYVEDLGTYSQGGGYFKDVFWYNY